MNHQDTKNSKKGGRAQRSARAGVASPTSLTSPTSREIRIPDTSRMALDAPKPLINLRAYQLPVFNERKRGILILHWSRQIGKSHVLAAWAVDRLLSRPGRLVTVLSNSRANGGEFVQKCRDVCDRLGVQLEKLKASVEAEDQSPDIKYENMRMEVRITLQNSEGIPVTGRIIVLAANPRTARGFSGDLILDEFAFHEDSTAIWGAVEPILSSNPDFQCRIASTGNGKHNMFYQLASGAGPSNGTFFESTAGYTVCRVTRTEAHKMGVKIYSIKGATRNELTPDQARKEANDKAAYDQNYECMFADENMTLLTHELISAAERSLITIDSQAWTPASIARMARAKGDLEVGNDIGRNRDLSFVTVIERLGTLRRVIAMLRMEKMRGPDQRKQLAVVCTMPKFRCYCGDMTGLGTFFIEELQEQFGMSRIHGVNFSTTEPITDRLKIEGRKQETARVTEIMATNLVAVFEDRAIEIPAEQELRDDLRKPERIVSPGGRVSIAATRDEAGHADGFWSLALAVRAGDVHGGPFAYQAVAIPGRAASRISGGRKKGVLL